MTDGAGPAAASPDGASVPALTLVFIATYGAAAVIWAWYAAPAAMMDTRWLGVSAILAMVLAVLSAIDIKTYRLPDVLTLPLAAGGLALSLLFNDGALVWRGASALAAFAVMACVANVYARVRRRAGLGLGDAKLFAAAGAWLGLEHLAAVLLAASLSALVFVAVKALRTGTLDPAMRLAFGPFLACAFWLVWLATA